MAHGDPQSRIMCKRQYGLRQCQGIAWRNPQSTSFPKRFRQTPDIAHDYRLATSHRLCTGIRKGLGDDRWNKDQVALAIPIRQLCRPPGAWKPDMVLDAR